MMRFLVVTVGLCPSMVIAQFSTNSPSSIYGLGDPAQSANAVQAAMGHTGIAFIHPSAVMASNPATYSNLRWPTFNLDMRHESLSLTDGASRSQNNAMSFQNFAFGFPLLQADRHKRKAGFAFGISPLTRTGYSIRLRQTVPELGPVDYLFNGNGSVNNEYMEGSYDLFAKRDSGELHALTLGFNANYVFGNINKIRATQILAGRASNVYRSNHMELSGVDFTFGLFYKKRFIVFSPHTEGKRGKRVSFSGKQLAARQRLNQMQRSADEFGALSAGITIRPSAGITTFQSLNSFTYSDTLPSPTPLDTVQSVKKRGITTMPMSIGAGLAFHYADRWTLSMEATRVMWSTLELPGQSVTYSDVWRLAAGSEYVPNPFAERRQFFARLRYRGGFAFEESFFTLAGSRPQRYGINFGLGLPLAASRSGSMLNISAEYATRQSPGISLSENFFTIMAGVIICPDLTWDQWFYRRKFD